MRLRTLSLENYRGFAQLELAFHPSVTVLVGVNGAGKSSILAAIAAVAQAIHEDIAQGAHAPDTVSGLELLSDADLRHDAHQSTLKLEVDAPSVSSDFPPGCWTVNFTRSRAFVGAGRPIVDRDHNAAQLLINHTTAPLFVHYTIARNVLEIPERFRTVDALDVPTAHDGALQNGTSNFRDFFEWCRDEEDAFNEQRLANLEGGAPVSSRLPAVRDAIERMLPGLTELRIEKPREGPF